MMFYFWAILLFIYFIKLTYMSYPSIDDIKKLKNPIKFTIIITISANIIYFIVLKTKFSSTLMITGSLMCFFGFLGFIYIIYSFYVFYKEYRKDKRKTKIKSINLELLVVIFVIFALTINLHEQFFRESIEKENRSYPEFLGEIILSDAQLINNLYSRTVTFKLDNDKNNPLGLVEFALSLNSDNFTYKVLDRYPFNNDIYFETTKSMIYWKFEFLKDDLFKPYIKLEFIWNKSLGEDFDSIDYSDSTYIKLEDWYYVQIIRKP